METAILTTKAATYSGARITGAVYLGYFVAAILGSVLVSRKIPGGTMLNALSDVLYAITTILLWRIFRRLHPRLAAVAALFSLAGCAVDAVHQLHLGLARVDPLVFFGPFCILLGLLILRSRFLPRWLAWPLMAAGVGWLLYLIPAVAAHGKVVIFPVGFLAEFALMLWLLLKGVNEERWRAASR